MRTTALLKLQRVTSETREIIHAELLRRVTSANHAHAVKPNESSGQGGQDLWAKGGQQPPRPAKPVKGRSGARSATGQAPDQYRTDKAP